MLNKGDTSNHVPKQTLVLALLIVIVGLAPMVLTVSYPENELFKLVSSKPIWYIYLFIVSMILHYFLKFIVSSMNKGN